MVQYKITNIKEVKDKDDNKGTFFYLTDIGLSEDDIERLHMQRKRLYSQIKRRQGKKSKTHF